MSTQKKFKLKFNHQPPPPPPQKKKKKKKKNYHHAEPLMLIIGQNPMHMALRICW